MLLLLILVAGCYHGVIITHDKKAHTRSPLFSSSPDDSDKEEKPGLLGELAVEEVLILVVLDGPLETWVILALSPWFVASSLMVSMMETVWTWPLVPFISSPPDRLLCLLCTSVFNYNLGSLAQHSLLDCCNIALEI